MKKSLSRVGVMRGVGWRRRKVVPPPPHPHFHPTLGEDQERIWDWNSIPVRGLEWDSTGKLVVLALEMSQEISQARLEQPERTEIVLWVTLGGL